MEQINKLLELMAYTLLFCLAVSFLLLEFNNIGQSISLLQISMYRQNIIREQKFENYIDDEPMLIATRGEIIGLLTGSMEVNININGRLYSPDSFERDSFDYATLPEGIYRKEYVLEDFYSDEKTYESREQNPLIKEIIFTHLDK